MKSAKTNILIINFLFGLFWMGLPLGASAMDSYKDFKRKKWDIDLRGQYYKTDGNYLDSSGAITSLSSSGSLGVADLSLETRAVMLKDFGIFASSQMTYAESVSGSVSRTNSGFTYLRLGMDYLMYSEEFDIIPELQYALSFDKISTDQDVVVLSDGANEAAGLIRLQRDTDGFLLHGHLGVNYRSEGRSMLMPWGFGSAIAYENGRMYGAEILGSNSIGDDVDAGRTTTRYNFLQRVNAGSLRFYAVNPRSLDAHLYYRTSAFKNWQFQLDAGFSLNGANSAAGYYVGGLIRYSFDFSPTRKSKNRARIQYLDPSNKEDQEIILKKFKEEVDDTVDQKIFQPEPIPEKPPQENDFDIQLKKKKSL